MRTFDSIAQFAEFLTAQTEAVGYAERHGLESAGRLLAEGAKDFIGHENKEWAPLADSTVAEKQRLGYTGRISGTDPLYRTGSLMASIVSEPGNGYVDVGSHDPVALWQFEGTEVEGEQRIPPRDALALSMHFNGQEAAERVGNYVMGAVAGKGENVPLVSIRYHPNEPV